VQTGLGMGLRSESGPGHQPVSVCKNTGENQGKMAKREAGGLSGRSSTLTNADSLRFRALPCIQLNIFILKTFLLIF